MMMVSFNHHRKLLNFTSEDESDLIIPKLCNPFCDAQLNPEGLCPLVCINLCGEVCKNPPPLPEAPPPNLVNPLIPHPKIFHLHLFLVIALAVLVAGFFFLTCYTIYKLYMKWVRSRLRRRSLSTGRVLPEDPDRDDELDEDVYGPVLDHPIWYIRTIGLQPSVISAISIVGFKKGEGLVEGTDCSICLTEFEEDENLRLLPKCNHAFHVPCIDTWLRSHTNCPMCRAPVVSNSSSIAVSSRELVAVRNNPGGGGGDGLGETREGDLNSGGEIGRDLLENDDGTTEVVNDGLGERQGDTSDGGGLELDGIATQPLRRSVSFDSLSASRISAAMTKALQGKSDGNSDSNRLVKDTESSLIVKNRVGSNNNLSILVQCPSMERSTQTDHQSCSSTVKRSVSCSAKVFLSRYGSRNQNLANSR